jgi:hypothetical protein
LQIEGDMWDETGGISLAETVKYINCSSLETLEVSAAGLSDISSLSEMLLPQVSAETFP